jgi:hypothetical protein
VKCLTFGNVVEHALPKATCLCGTTLAEIDVETFAMFTRIAATTAATTSARPVFDTLVNRLLAQRRYSLLSRLFALTFQFLQRLRTGNCRQDQAA